jgi:hypothetical protein
MRRTDSCGRKVPPRLRIAQWSVSYLTTCSSWRPTLSGRFSVVDPAPLSKLRRRENDRMT